ARDFPISLFATWGGTIPCRGKEAGGTVQPRVPRGTPVARESSFHHEKEGEPELKSRFDNSHWPVFTILLLATTVLLGCPQAPQEEMEGPKAESILPPEPEAQEANACPEGAVALVGEHPITLEDAEKRAKMNLKHEGI